MIARDTLVFELNKGQIPASQLEVGDKILSDKYCVVLNDGSTIPVSDVTDFSKVERSAGYNPVEAEENFIEVKEIVYDQSDSYYNYYGFRLTGDHVFLEWSLLPRAIREAMDIPGQGPVVQINETIDVIGIKTAPLKPNKKRWFNIYYNDGTISSMLAVSGDINNN